jgi:hypothetical protein
LGNTAPFLPWRSNIPKIFVLNGDLDAEPDPSCGITILKAESWKEIYEKLGLPPSDVPPEDTIQTVIGDVEGTTSDDATLQVLDTDELHRKFYETVEGLAWDHPYVIEQAYKFLHNIQSYPNVEGEGGLVD